MKRQLTQERRNHITNILLSQGTIRVSELAKQFSVSSETIRKDLIYLEKRGIASKGYGGAVIASEIYESNFLQKSVRHADEKNQIAREAVKYISPGSVLIMDSGSTVYSVARELRLREDITVFTNCINIAALLSDSKVKVYIIGGEVKSTSKAAIGLWGIEAIKSIKVDIAFLGTSGFSQRPGPCVESHGEAQMKMEMIKSSRKRIVVADSSKARENAVFQFAKWNDIDLLITDSGMDEDVCRDIKEHTKIIIAGSI